MRKIALLFALAGSISFSVANPQTGCGLGDLVIKNPDSTVMYVLNWTTNNTFGLQTFGISSGTLGCSSPKFAYNERVQEFVAANIDALSKEMAQGKGENLDALAELLAIEDKDLFKSKLQENYLLIYASKDVKMSDVLDLLPAL